MGLFSSKRMDPEVRYLDSESACWPAVIPLLARDVVTLRGLLGPPVEPWRLNELFGETNITTGERVSRFNDEYHVAIATTPEIVEAAFAAEPRTLYWAWVEGLLNDMHAYDAHGQLLWDLATDTGVISVRPTSAAYASVPEEQ